MKSTSREYRAVHRAEDKIEPRMARAVIAATKRLQARIPYRQIEKALEQKDLRKVKAILAKIDFEDAYVPSSEIVKDSVIRGGKLADEEIRNG